MSAAPILHIIAGPNAAGKTSFYEAILRHLTDAEFVNADRLVAAEIGAHATTEAQAKQGQALTDERRAALLAERQGLVTESTASPKSNVGGNRRLIIGNLRRRNTLEPSSLEFGLGWWVWNEIPMGVGRRRGNGSCGALDGSGRARRRRVDDGCCRRIKISPGQGDRSSISVCDEIAGRARRRRPAEHQT